MENIQDTSKTSRTKLPSSHSYTLVCCHLESLSSSLSPALHLSQLGASSWPPAPSTETVFFRPVLPEGLPDYIDNYKLGGDLLLNLNMTREDDGNFQFRRRFEVVPTKEAVMCGTEEAALRDLLSFLESRGSNIVVVCMDEDTVTVLLRKLREVDSQKCRRLGLVGYSWWRRILKHLGVKNYRTLELDEFHSSAVPWDVSKKHLDTI